MSETQTRERIKMLFLEKEPTLLNKMQCNNGCTIIEYDDIPFEIIPCSSVKELNNMQEDFDAILYDIDINQSPIPTLNALNKKFKSVPIIVLTSITRSDNTIDLLQNGAYDYILKGFDNYKNVLYNVSHIMDKHEKLKRLRAIAKTFLDGSF